MSSPERTLGVLVMSYGSPESLDKVEPYYTDIRRGRPPSPEQLAELIARYEAIGGTTALATHSASQLAAIRTALDLIAASSPAGAVSFVLEAGHKHAAPSIEAGVDALASKGVDGIVGVVLAPHFSQGSIGTYLDRAAARCTETGVAFSGIQRWWDLPEFVAFGAEAVRAQLDDRTDRSLVLFTAHSLPLRVLEGDPYQDELYESARLVAEAAGLDKWAQWSCAWQSAGRTPEPWAGPDILEVLQMAADTGRADRVVVYPHGFTSTHLEVAYDLDIEASRAAAKLGLEFGRCAVVGDDPTVMGALAARIAAAGFELADTLD